MPAKSPSHARKPLFTLSIRFRLTLWTTLVAAMILAAFSLFIYYQQANQLEAQTQSALQMKSQQLQVTYQVAGFFEHDEEHFQPPSLTSQEGLSVLSGSDRFALVGPDGKVLQRAGKIDDAAIQQLSSHWQSLLSPIQPIFYRLPQDPNTLYLITALFSDNRWIGLILIGSPTDPSAVLPRLAFNLGLGSLVFLALALLGSYWLAWRALSPVTTITRTARSISESDFSRRLNLNSRDELGELSATFDEMLDRLQAAFDRQRQFTADASHELRTPLTIMQLAAEQALEKSRSPQEYQLALKNILAENEYISGLVNDLLTLARMDAGQTRLHFESLDLGDLALETAERLSPLARRDGVEITLGELAAAPVSGDRQYLTQMLTNLVENAIKYAGGAGHTIHLDTGIVEKHDQRLAWAHVKDDGPGISPDHLPHLFDRFYRVDKSRARRDDDTAPPEGSGLGLAIVQWVAHAHHGAVNVESQPGQGTRFEVLLPAATGLKPGP